MANEIDKQLEEASKSLKPAFKQVVDSLADSNKAVALTAANFRNTSRDSFKGALAAQKMRDTLAKVADGLKSGEGQLGNIDFAEFKKVSETTQQLEQELLNAQEARANRLATAEKKENSLGKKDLQIAALKEKQSTLQGQALNNATKQLEELEKAREEQKTRILAAEDRKVKEAQAALEEETKVRDEYNNQLEGILKATNEESGKRLGEFSEGLKELTGFDLMDSFDSVVKKINGVGLIFGKQDLFGDVVGGIQNLASGLSTGIQNVSAGIMSGLKATGTYFMGLGDTFKEGGLSAVTEQLNADLGKVWNSMKEGAGNLMDGIKSGWSKGVEGAKKGFQMFKAGSMNLLRGLGSFLASTLTFVTGLVMAGASLVASGVTMLAGVLGISATALAIGLVGILLIAAGIYLYNNSEGFRAAIDTVVGYFMDVISIIGNIFGGFYDFFAGLFTGDFDRMFGGLKDIFGGIWDLIKAPFKAIGDFFRNVFDIDIKSILRSMAEKILPGWVVNKIFGKEDSEPPMQAENVQAMQRGSQKELTSEEIDALPPEELVKLGYAKVTSVTGEDGKESVQFEETDKYMDVLKSEGVTSGGGFTGSATGITAQEMLMADPTRAAELKAENQAVAEGNRTATNQAVVTTINNAPTQMSNTTIKGTTPTPRDTDPTGSRLSAVPA